MFSNTVFFFFMLISTNLLASPIAVTLQSRIAKPDGFALEASSVNFRISITDTVGSCVIYQEDFPNHSMVGSKGLVSLTLGSGSKSYPAGPMTIQQVFNNFASPAFNCQSGGTINAGLTDRRKLVLQFNDGSGWQTVPAMDINSTPYSFNSITSFNLGDYPANDYLRTATLPTCGSGEALHFNGTSITCVASGSVANGGNNGSLILGTNDNNSLQFETNSTTRMTILPTGNVGIGTTNPTNLFQVEGGSSTTGSGVGISLTAQTSIQSGGSAYNGGGLSLSAGHGYLSGVGGDISLNAGRGNLSSGMSGFGASLLLTSSGNAGAGGGVTLSGGNGNNGYGNSGNLTIGATSGTGHGGLVALSGGSGSTGGALSLAAGNGGTVNGNGGAVSINGGAADGSGINGNVYLANLRGNVGVGASSAAAKLDVAGEVKVGNTALGCTAGARGAIRYNTGTNVLEFCNGTAWHILQAAACSDPTPDVFTFTNEPNATISTTTTSNIIQVSGFNCVIPITISGQGTPQFRTCSDSGCSTVIQGWTASPSSLNSGDYLQIRLTSDSIGGSPYQAIVIAGSGATAWTVTTAGGDCVGSTPPVGTVCADGTIYAGLSSDGSVKMFTTRCDYGQTWDGTNCTGSRSSYSWNNGSAGAGFVNNGYSSLVTGEANTTAIAVLANGGSPYAAAIACDGLTENGHSDWYLPSRTELSALYSGKNTIRNFVTTSGSYYWSSSEDSASSALVVDLNDGFVDGGYHGHGNKNLSRYFRCVRR